MSGSGDRSSSVNGGTLVGVEEATECVSPAIALKLYNTVHTQYSTVLYTYINAVLSQQNNQPHQPDYCSYACDLYVWRSAHK